MATYSSYRIIMGKMEIYSFCYLIGNIDFFVTEMFIDYTPNGYIVPAEFGILFLPRMKNVLKEQNCI